MTRLAVRRAWFQVHKWIGLILMIALMPLAASGSLLVAHDWLGEAPKETPIAAPLPIARYLAAAAPELPQGARISGITWPTRERPGIVTVRASRPQPDGAAPRGPQMPIRLQLDAATGQPLAVQPRDGGGFWMAMHRFHGSLLIPGAGRAIVGWLGVAMLVSCVSGLWIWWPTVSGFVRGLRWRRGKDWDFNLHHMTGFWIALPLAVLSLTGTWISFPAFFSPLVGERAPQRPGAMGMSGQADAARGERGAGRGDGSERGRRDGARGADAGRDAEGTRGGVRRDDGGRADGGGRGDRPAPAAPVQTVEQVIAVAAARGPIADLAFPGAQGPRWTATTADGRRIAIDDATGTIAAPERPRQGPVMRWMRLIHEGAGETGIVWRTIVFLGGIIPVILGVTGILMWLRARRWRGELARRQAAKRERVVA